MSHSTHDFRLFGLDLRALWQDMCRPWQNVHRWPLLSWLSPEVPIRLLQSDGHESVWLGSKTRIKSPGTKEAASRFVAVELPEDLVLRRKLLLPAMSEPQTAEAVSLEMRALSPFPVNDLVGGYATHFIHKTQSELELVLASRKQIEQYLQTQVSRLAGVVPEVWAFAGADTPVVLTGFGETHRASYVARWRRIGYALLLFVMLMFAVIALTPTAQLRLRAIEAVNAYTAVHHRIQPLAYQREALVKATERLAVVKEAMSSAIDPLRIIDLLTQALPDDTSLQSLQIQGLKVSMAGLTTNAAALMQHLSTQPGIRDVKAPTAATRRQGAAQENFTVEFTLDPKVIAPAADVESNAPKAAVVSVAPTTSAPVFMAPEAISQNALQKAASAAAKAVP